MEKLEKNLNEPVIEDTNKAIAEKTNTLEKTLEKVDTQKSISEKDESNKAANIKQDVSNTKTSKKETKPNALTLPKKNKKKKIILFSLIFILILALLVLSTIFSIITDKSDKIISGISINGIDISNLSKSDALVKLKSELSTDLNKNITLTKGEYSTILNTESLEVSYDFEKSVDEAYNIGRNEGNIFINNYKIISTLIFKKTITPSINLNSDLLTKKIEEINNELPDRVINANYKIENNNLIIGNSYSGYKIKTDDLTNKIFNAISTDVSSIEIPVEKFEATKPDIEAIYKEIYKAPVDATFTTNPYSVVKEETGLDFAISIDEAKSILAEEKDSYIIPLKTLTPNVTTKTLPQEAFPDLLASYSTSFATSNYNRSTNIALATNSVNGYVLMPGETFSYNSTVGQRTAARGYKEAGVYVNGEVTTGIGGGICQVSSTIYNAVLLSNLEVTERLNHTFIPSYVPAGQDATVSWGYPDFKFKNNRNYPIKIVASSANRTISINIYGLKTDDDYTVKISSSRVATIPFNTQYKDDPTLPSGTTKIIQSGSNGCKTQTYKILYKDGVEISRTLINSDTYQPHNQVIARGTKLVAAPPSTNNQTPTDSGISISNVPTE